MNTARWPPTVTVTWFETTDDVVWTGHDGKPRCAQHPYVCLVLANPRPSINHVDPNEPYVCHVCMKEALETSS